MPREIPIDALMALARTNPGSLTVGQLAQVKRLQKLHADTGAVKAGARGRESQAYRVPTHREVAAFFGRSIPAVRLWSREGMPGKPGAYDLSEIARWRLDRAEQRSPDALASEREERVALIRERKLKLRQDREVAAGKLHDTQECHERRLRQIHAVKAGLLDLPRALSAPLAEVTTPAAVEALIEERVRRLLSEFAGDRHAKSDAKGDLR